MDIASLMVILESLLKGVERNRKLYIQFYDPNRLECIDKSCETYFVIFLNIFVKQ